jgi:glycosyltransferase involved in cell wall biosynthesis
MGVPSRRIRVAQIITGLELGGGGAVVSTIGRALDRTRFEMDVYCINEGGDMQPELERLGYRVVWLEGAWDYRRRLMPYSVRQILRLAGMLRASQYDVVHTHIFPADVIGRVAARLAGVPVMVKSLHNMGQWKTTRHIVADRFLGRWTGAVICCSAFQLDVASAQERMRPGVGVVINNGVALHRFDVPRSAALARELGLDPQRLVVGTVGRMVEAKGHRYFVEAIPQVLARRPDAQFLFVGDGQLRKTLWDQLPTAARPNVCFAGARADIPELMALMDVFVFPSISEAFGIALIEAMASRLPVVASDIRPLRDIVVPGETGLLVPAHSSGPLADAIISLLENPERERFGACGRRRVESHYTDEQMVRATEDIYVRLLAAKASARRAHTSELAPGGTSVAVPPETGQAKS